MEQKLGCILIHGFAGGVYEIEPLAKYLKVKGFETVCVRLKGHTGSRRDLINVGYKDWLASAEEDYSKLQAKCNKIVVIGFSMGGLVAVNLVVRYGAAALVMLCAPVYHWDLKRVAINLHEDFKSGNFKNLRHYLKSATIPLPALINFKILLAKTKKIMKGAACPIFIAQALKDDTVQHRSAEYIYSTVSSAIKEKKYYGKSGHVICLSPDAQELFSDVEGFIRKVVIE